MRLLSTRGLLVTTLIGATCLTFGVFTAPAGASGTEATVTTAATTSYTSLYSLTSDPDGNLYSVDFDSGAIIEVPAGASTPIVIANDPDGPEGITYHDDDLYIVDYSGEIKEMSATGGSLQVLVAAPSISSGESSGENIVFDAAGDMFVANYESNVIGEVVAGTSTEITSGITLPSGPAECGPWAMRAVGNDLYITCYESGELLVTSLAVPLGGETPTEVNTPSILYAGGIAEDGSGNLYISGYAGDNIVVVPTDGSSAYVLSTDNTVSAPWGIIFENGSLYVTSYSGYNLIYQINLHLQVAPSAVTNLSVAQNSISVSASWTGNNASSYTCTLLYGFNDPSTFTESTTATSCSFNNVSGSTFGISVTALSDGLASPAASAFSTYSPAVTVPAAPKKTSIVCVNAKHSKRVTAVHPRCPAGYWKK